MGTGELLGKLLTHCGGVTCDGLASRPGEVEILLAAHATETGIGCGSYEPVLPPRLHFFYALLNANFILS